MKKKIKQEKQNSREPLSIRHLFLLLPIVPLIMILSHLAGLETPFGHDSLAHMENTISLAFWLQNDLAEILPFLRSIEFHWPPLTYLITSMIFIISPTRWAFHGINFGFTLAFLILFIWVMKQFVKDNRLILAGVLLLQANPIWILVSISYFLEIGQLAALMIIMSILISRHYESSPPVAISLGVVLGIAVLSKAVIGIHILLPFVIAMTGSFFGKDKRAEKRIRSMIFFLFALLVPLLWYGPMLGKISRELIFDMSTYAQQADHPWWFYFKVMVFDFAAIPFFLLCLFGLFFIKKEDLSCRILIPFSGGVTALIFFSLMGTKWPWFSLASYILLVISLLALLDRVKKPIRKIISILLIAVYSFLAIGIWFPQVTPYLKAVSLGSSNRPDFLDKRSYKKEMAAADNIYDTIKDNELGGIGIVDFSRSFRFSDIEKMICLKSNYFALIRGLNRSMEKVAASLPETRHLVAVERKGGKGLSFDALFISKEIERNRTHELITREALRNHGHLFEEISRMAFDGVYLVIYKNRSPISSWEKRLSANDFTELYNIMDPGRFPQFYKRTLNIFYRGDIDRAMFRYQRMLAIHPDQIEAAKGAALCIRTKGHRAKEGELLFKLLEMFPDHSDASIGWINRLYYLSGYQEVKSTCLKTMEMLLQKLEPGNRTRSFVLDRLIEFHLKEESWERAFNTFLAEFKKLEEKDKSKLLLTFSKLILTSKLPTEYKEIFLGLLEDDPLISEKQKGKGKRWVYDNQFNPDDFTSTEPFREIPDARLFTKHILKTSHSLRNKGQRKIAVKIIDSQIERMKICPVCIDELLLEKGRILLDLGEKEEAFSALLKISSDNDLKRIGKSLIRYNR